MITLITGGPGTGKTAWIINEVLKLQEREQRPLYVHGIRDFKLPHQPIYCKSKLCDLCQSKEIDDDALFVEDWPTWKQPGALIIIDEVQRIWRPRASATAPHQSVSMLETHRHYGVDFWIVSQGPHLFDSFIRALVGRHIHLVANWAGRTQYEWPECRQQLQYRGDAVKRPYTLPKRVYKLYHSAEVHTKQDKRIPLAVYGLIGAVITAATLIYFIVGRLSDPSHIVNTAAPAAPPGVTSSAPASGVGAGASPGSVPSGTFPDFEPEKKGVPESAPAYRHLIQIKAAPILVGCVKSAKKCQCYTQQATPYPATQVYCENVVAGNAFNPYLDRKAPPPPVQQAQPLQHPQSSAIGSEPSVNVSQVTIDDTDIATHSD